MGLPPLSGFAKSSIRFAWFASTSWITGRSSLSSCETSECSSASTSDEAATLPSMNRGTSLRSKSETSSRLIFLGTGSSTGCPRPLCAMVFQSSQYADRRNQEQYRKLLGPDCQVSNLAMMGTDVDRQQDHDPRRNKNYRNNPSFLISLVDDNQKQTNILIDAGKTFREGALRWFPVHGVSSLDAIVLTHHHMDAAAGLDDVRGFQKWTGLDRTNGNGSPRRAVPMPLYLSQHCLDDLQERFPWLLPKEKLLGSHPTRTANPSIPVVERHVASLDVHVFESFRPFEVGGLKITPLPVMHGEDLVSFGFAFTVDNVHVVYLSDISRMLPETMHKILNGLPPTDILVIDALHPDKPNAVHFNLEQAMEVVHSIRPKQTYLVGMNCDSFLPHDEMNQQLRAKYGAVQLAYDGQVIEASEFVRRRHPTSKL